MKIAVYAGSFDPITLGHMDIIERASRLFDKLHVSIGKNSNKKPFLPDNTRKELIELSCVHLKNVEIDTFDGLLVNHCRSINAMFIVRGLRAVTDFEYELGLAYANRTQAPFETIFLPTKHELAFVSSSTVRELAKLHGNLQAFVSPFVEREINQYINK